MDARLQYLTTTDNIRLYYEMWFPDHPKANIIFVHGLGDHIGRYAEFVKYFIGRNFGMCLYDQRGHGRSGGRRVHCRSFSDYLRDLSMMIERVHESYPNVPLYLIGHSFGGQVAINFVARYSKGLRGVVALSPNIEPLIKIPNWKKKLADKISRFLPATKFHTEINAANFSHDENVVESAKKDPFMSWHVTARLGTELLKNLEQLPRMAFQVKVPILFMHGSDDRICSSEATRKFYHSILTQNKDLKIYPGLYHELLNENVRQNIFADIETWLNGQIVAFKRLAKSSGEENYEGKETSDLWNYSRDLPEYHIE